MYLKFTLITLTVMLLTCLSPLAIAQSQWVQEGTDFNGAPTFDELGGAVDMNTDGSVIIMGASKKPGNSIGEARIYSWNGTSWIQKGLTLTGDVSPGKFGHSVSIDASGNTIAVGSPIQSAGGNSRGQVKIYEWNGTAWVQKGFTFSGDADHDQCGASVSLSNDGNTIVIGSASKTVGSLYQGIVRVFNWNGSVWVQKGSSVIGGAAGTGFGETSSISADGNVIAVGGTNYTVSSNNVGYVRVYEWDASNGWTQRGNQFVGSTHEGMFGSSVAISGDGITVIAGAVRDATAAPIAGKASSFRWNGTTWIQKGADILGESFGGQCGKSVSINEDGSIIAVGSWFYTGGGRTRVFKWNGVAWAQEGSDITAAAADEASGAAVSLASDGSKIIVGAPYNNEAGNISGEVRVFKRVPATQLRFQDCDITISFFNQFLYAESLAGATTYQFRFEDAATGAFESYFRQDGLTHMRPSWINMMDFNKTYNVKVRAKINNAWTPFGKICQITTPTLNTNTQLNYHSCGQVLTSMNQNISCTTIQNATHYQFRFTQGSNVFTKTRNDGVGTIKVADVTGLQYSVAYQVDIRVKYNGVWYPYGPTCWLEMPPAGSLLTQLNSESCNGGAFANQTVNCLSVPGATNYQFRMEEFTSGTVLTYISGTTGFKPIWVTGIQNAVYITNVRAKVNGNWINYGPMCLMTISNAPMAPPPVQATRNMAMESDIEQSFSEVSISLYPNPNNGQFQIQLDQSVTDSYTVTVHNALGQEVYNKQHLDQQISIDISGASPGLYFVRTIIGTSQKTLKIVIR
jgi:hypothetical protein